VEAQGPHPDLVFRPYAPADRARVRDICFETGYMGEPVAWQWPDAESWADMFTGYYTDHEPESALVVERDGVVAGYLLGCLDSSRAWNPAAVAGRHIVRRGIAFRRGTRRVIARTFTDGASDLVHRRLDRHELEFSDPRYPAHVHIDLLPTVRGIGAGRRLMSTWLDALRRRDVPGCHLQKFAENTGATAFFEACGFRRVGRSQPVPGLRTRDGGRLHTEAMVQELEAGPAAPVL
jgi:ribosomal protein S18 acetylase RimI-like enzyme